MRCVSPGVLPRVSRVSTSGPVRLSLAHKSPPVPEDDEEQLGSLVLLENSDSGPLLLY